MSGSRVTRKLAAIVAIDMVGYSRLMGGDEDGTIARQKAHRAQVFDPKINEYQGRIVKTTGDGLLVEFGSAVDAVMCAVQVQQAVADLEAGGSEERRIDYRIGINQGDIVIDDDDIFGDGVNVAARLEGLAEPGGILVSDAVFKNVKDKLDLHFADMGHQKVKNIAEPIHVYRPVTGVTRPGQSGHRRISRRLVYNAVVATLFVLTEGLGTWLLPSILGGDSSSRLTRIDSPRLSIAVLPFSNKSGDSDQNYLADALTEDITSDLSRISGSFVISRSSMATYRGKEVDTKQIGREMKVRYLLQGSVRKVQAKVFISVRLIDAETSQQLWSERYVKTGGDLYAFQSEVTGRVARTLNLELKVAASRRIAQGPANTLGAQDLALRAWAEIWTKPQNRATNDAALAYVRRALALDPRNAEAHGIAAYAYARAANYGWSISRNEGIKKGIAAGERAIQLDPKNADAFYALGFLYYMAGETQRSQELLRQCIALNRNHAPAYFFSGLNLIRLGKPRDAVTWVERAFSLSPRDPLRSIWFSTIARAQILIGEDAKAIRTALKGVATNPNHLNNYAALASAYAHLGQLDKAKAALGRFQRLKPDISLRKYRQMIASDDPTARKAYERLLNGLRIAGLPE